MATPGRALQRPRFAAVVLLAIWLLCFGLTLRALLLGVPLPPFRVVAGDSGGAPIVADLRLGLELENRGLHRGDRILHFGGVSLAGVGPLGLFVVANDVARAGDEVTVVLDRSGEEKSLTIRLASFSFMWGILLNSLAWALLSMLLYFRAQWTESSRYGFWASAGLAIMGAGVFSGGWPEILIACIASSGGAALTVVGGLLFVHAFLREPSREPYRPPLWPWLFLAIAPAQASRVFSAGLHPSLGRPAFGLLLVASVLIGLVMLSRSLRRAAPVQRAQIIWILAGVYCGIGPVALGSLLVLLDSRLTPLLRAAMPMTLFIPILWSFAIVRFGTFDIHRLLNATAMYTGFLIVSFASFFLLQASLVANLLDGVGGRSAFHELPLVLALAAVGYILYRRAEGPIERFMFPERVRLRQGVGVLLLALSRCRDVESIAGRVGSELSRLVTPEFCSVYATASLQFERLYHEAAAATPPLAATLALRQQLEAAETAFTPPRERAGFFSAAQVLDGPSVPGAIVPVRHRGRLVVAIVLGRKASGDEYTAADLNLLDAVARVIATELDRFEDAKLAAVGESLTQMMQDIQGPLRALRATSESLVDESVEPALHVEEMRAQYGKMRRMVNDVLAFARGEQAVLLREVDLREFLSGIRRQLMSDAPSDSAHVDVDTTTSGLASFDPTQVRAALVDLLRAASRLHPRNRPPLQLRARWEEAELVFELQSPVDGLARLRDEVSWTAMESVAGAHGGTLTVADDRRIWLRLPWMRG